MDNFYVNSLIAEGDQVALEGRGEAPKFDGGSYDNTYCIVVTVRDGEILQIREYLDTELATATFGSQLANSWAACAPDRGRTSDRAALSSRTFRAQNAVRFRTWLGS